MWGELDLPRPLNWSHSEFNRVAADQIPSDRTGVYAFVLEPNIADLKLGYLLYVGMTKAQNFQTRFRQYLYDQENPKAKRLLVKQMLITWPEHLTFYYSQIDDQDIIKSVEDKLIAAFKPPFNRSYPASVRRSFKILDDQGG